MSPLVLATSAWDAFTFPEPYSMRPVLTKHRKVSSAQHLRKVLVGCLGLDSLCGNLVHLSKRRMSIRKGGSKGLVGVGELTL